MGTYKILQFYLRITCKDRKQRVVWQCFSSRLRFLVGCEETDKSAATIRRLDRVIFRLS